MRRTIKRVKISKGNTFWITKSKDGEFLGYRTLFDVLIGRVSPSIQFRINIGGYNESEAYRNARIKR